MHPLRPLTRRRFLLRSAHLGLAAGAAALGPGLVTAQTPPDVARRVLIEDLIDSRSQLAAGSTRHHTASGRLAARHAFTHVGLHWQGPPDVPVDVQTSADGLAWTPWRRLLVERRPGETRHADETFAALIGAPRHRFVQYRFNSGSANVGDVTATCLNSVDGPRGSALRGTRNWFDIPAARADGADFRSGIRTREQWEAYEDLRLGPSAQLIWEPAYVAPRMVVVHHTATDNDYTDAAAEVRAIYTYHAVTEGFGDIGYNVLIDADGIVYEGRRGRDQDPFEHFDRDVVSFGVVAGHAFDYNYGSVGVALLGNFQERTPSTAMLRSLEEVLVFEHRRHQIDPRASGDFARSTRLWRYDLPALAGHRDCNNTECPGDSVYSGLPELRARVAERLDAAGVEPVSAITDWPSDRNVWLAPAAFAWAGRAPFDCVFEGFDRPIGEDRVVPLVGYDARSMPEHVVTAQRGATFVLREPGQYTLHLQPRGSSFADRRTVLADTHVVTDNADPRVTRTGTWTPSRNILEFYGRDYEVAEADTDARFAWTLAVPESGQYRVQVCWAAAPDRSHRVRYSFGLAGSDARTVVVDQTQSGGMWVELGRVELEAGETCQVEVRAASDGVVIADAARLLLA